ncbi:MAG: translation initiation factor [Verrucomicrobiota bacterium]|nr:translation initiation factor [Verrucomicrobiota bacterium]
MSTGKKNKISTDGGSFLHTDVFIDLESFASLNLTPEINSKTVDKKTPTKKPRGRVEVQREKAGRGGKTVTTLKSFSSHTSMKTLELMTFEFKKLCACGGTLKGRVIELQGDVCDQVCEKLKAEGFQPVRAGG